LDRNCQIIRIPTVLPDVGQVNDRAQVLKSEAVRDNPFGST